MSMVAHGYGISNFGSPNLVFSNILWGYLVRALPEIQGILGYSLATLVTIWLAGTAILQGMIRLGIGALASYGALLLILARPVLFPQFTINAGLLMIGAVIFAHLYGLNKSHWVLILGCALAYASFIVRIPEFTLILLIAMPLLPWHVLRNYRTPRIAIALLLTTLVVSAAFDHNSYQSVDWHSFNDLNPARAPITDFGADYALKQRPDIIERHGYSVNDIDLIAKFFLVDGQIADPRKLNAMLSELAPRHAWEASLDKGLLGIKGLFHPALSPITVAALLLAFLHPSWNVAATWGLTVIALFAIGFYGRPAILHTYIPVASLLVIAPLLMLKPRTWRLHLTTVIIVIAAAFNTVVTAQESLRLQARAAEIRTALAGFPISTIAVWGATFPFESVYPAFHVWQPALQYRIHGLGTFSLAPFSVTMSEQHAGRSVAELLKTEGGLPIIADPLRMNMLKIYCAEHFSGRLREISSADFGPVTLSWQRCEALS